VEVCWGERPLDTEDTVPVDAGRLEMEVGADYVSGHGDELWRGSSVLTVGLIEDLDASVQASGLVIDLEDEKVRGGVGDTVLATKYRLLEETRWPAALFSALLRLPTGDADRDLGFPGVGAQMLVAARKTVERLTLTGNVGRTFETGGVDEFWNLASSAEYALTDVWELAGEIVAAVGADGAPDLVVARGGVVLAASERVRWDAALAGGLTSAAPDVIVTTGVTILLF
jgi:hypothetical protein